MKRETNQLRKTIDGHPRVCPRCKRNVSTKKVGRQRVFVTHGPDPSGPFFCGQSGKSVE